MNRIIISLIILSGIFYYQLIRADAFYSAQFAFFVFSAGIFGSIVLYRLDKWMGLLFGLSSSVFLKTYLFQQSPQVVMFENALLALSIFGIYYVVRYFKRTEDSLKFFLIPAMFNIILIIVQAFDHNFLPFMPVKGVQGFLGNASVSGCFIALTTPIFIRYFKQGLPLLFFAIILTKSFVAMGIFLITLVVYFWFIKHRSKRLLTILCLIMVVLGCYYYRDKIIIDIKQRSAMYVGTLDGIKHNPILGWGVGSFEPIMSSVKPQDSRYAWGQFNYDAAIMNHPHNEILLGWWNCGILFPILLFYLCWDLVKKFKTENALSFSILVGGFVCMMFYFLNPPHWLLIMFALGIYHNTNKEEICQNIA